MIVQVFRIHIINAIVSNTTMNRNSKPVWSVHGILYSYMYIISHKSNVQFVLHV